MIQFNTWMRRAFLLCLELAIIVGCAEVLPRGSAGHTARQALIGKTKQEVFACAGKPVSEKSEGDRTVIIYYKEASVLEESFPGSKSSFAMAHHGCRATIALGQDRVSEVRYDSVPSSYQDEGHCEEIFELCTSP